MKQKNDYIWNTLAGLINAAEAVVMSMIVTRVTGLQDAGIITIAFAIGNTMMTIGKFGVRNYQVTDVNRKYSFKEYLLFRIITNFLMVFASGVYLWICYQNKGYSIDKIMSIAAIIFIYTVESFEDAIWGELQLNKQLAKGAQMFVFRWIGILTAFCLVIVFRKNMTEALWISAIISIALFILCIKLNAVKYVEKGKPPVFYDRKEKLCSLLQAVFPLFLVSFLTFYVNNAPKYAIDGQMSEEVQACYGFVAMPVFVMGLLNNFIYQPTLVELSYQWNSGNYIQVEKKIKTQMIILALLTVVVLIGAFLLGVPALSWLYATNLQEYKRELLILLLGGSFLALSGYFNVILTIMRCQKELLIGYGIIAILAVFGLDLCVLYAGTLGVALGYFVLMCLLALIYGVMIMKQFRKVKN